MTTPLPTFKIGITFSGEYRNSYVKPFCDQLLEMGYRKPDIFYDEWHETLFNGPNGDSVFREIYYSKCECVVVLLSPDYNKKKWTHHIEWPAIRELINTDKAEKICLLQVGSVDISQIDGLYQNQAIAKPIDNMTAGDIASFIDSKYKQVSGHVEKLSNPNDTKADRFCNTNILSETYNFLQELNSLTLTVPNSVTINVLKQLQLLPREGKKQRLKNLANPQIKPRTVYDHIISLAYLADAIDKLIGESKWNASDIARLIAYHEIPEAIIGDIASYTSYAGSETIEKGPERFETSKREVIVNRFISLYADKKQQDSIGYLNNRISPTGKRKAALSEQMKYFKALDRLDCIVAIWRYLFYYRDECTIAQRIAFINGMSDFFTNKRLKEDDLFIKTPVFERMIAFLSDKQKAKRYVQGESIQKIVNKEDSLIKAIVYLVENVPLFADTDISPHKSELYIGE